MTGGGIKRGAGLRLLIASLKPYKAEMVLAGASILAKHLSTITLAGLVAYMLGLAMENSLSGRFLPLVCLLGLCVVLKTAAYYAEMWLCHHVAYKVLKDFRIYLYGKIEQLAPAFIFRGHTGNIGATLMSDVELLEWFLAHTFVNAIVAVLTTVLVLAAIALVSPPLCAITAFFSLLTASIPLIFQNKADKQGREVREKHAGVSSISMETIHGLKDIIMYNSREYFTRKAAEGVKGLYDAQIAFWRRLGVENMLTQLLAGLFMVTVMGGAAALVAAGLLDFKAYPMAVILSLLVLVPIIEVCEVSRNLGLVFAAANRMEKIFNAIPEVTDSGVRPEPKSGGFGADIEFSQVTFSYGEKSPAVLRDISFRIPGGRTTALVGASGAGKTTSINLLLRFHQADYGRIMIGGVDIATLPLETLRKMVTVVSQDVYLFNMSIADNIRLGRKEADDEEVVRAAKAAAAHDFITEMPEGYRTPVGERGLRLSGGQRQRIAIARALIKNSPIVIFDEAVSSLDAENERYIWETVEKRFNDRTVIVAAHRLSTIAAADWLIVLDQGRAVQSGRHEMLIRQQGRYRELMAIQP